MISKNPMKHMAIIPARLASTRLPNKPLQKIGSKRLIEFVAEEVLKTALFKEVFVATDSTKIISLFKDSQVTALMTDPAHQSGTDRIFEASQKITNNFDSVVNIQGDEPFVYKEDLEELISSLEEGLKMVSFYEQLKTEDLDNLNKVKVVLNNKSEAMYFSRLPISFSRVEKDIHLDPKFVGKHIGLYGYSKDFLKEFCKHELGFHEKNEKLEQLRALQMGEKIKMLKTTNTYHGVDTQEDLDRVNKILKKASEQSER